jgi:hypothetical protein
MTAISWCRVSCKVECRESFELDANDLQDIWFHRYQDGRDIEGRFDYNSWQESPTGLKLAASLDRDVVLAEGTKPLPFSSMEIPI